VLREALDRGEKIAGSRTVAACLTFDADPGRALARAREVGREAAVAGTPDLLAE
jgi:hypothetical protein